MGRVHGIYELRFICLVLYSTLLRLVFSSSIHLEVASGPFCLLVNSPWLLVFILSYFFLSLSGFNLYCWKGLHFSWSNSLVFLHLFFIVFFTLHHWFRDLLRELGKKYEVLLIIFFLVFLLFLVSEGLLFVSFFWASFHSLSSPTLGIWPGEGFYLPDPCELTFANTLLLFPPLPHTLYPISHNKLIWLMTGKEWRVCGRVVGGGKDQIILETAVAMERFSLQYSLLLSCPFSCSKKSHEGNDSKKEKSLKELICKVCAGKRLDHNVLTLLHA